MSDQPPATPQGATPQRRSPSASSEQLRASPNLLRALRELHLGFCRTLSAKLSSATRATVEVRLQHVDSLRYQAFADRLDRPTCLAAIHLDGTDEPLQLEIKPGILFPLLDRLLGGGQESGPTVRRPLTQIEQRLAAHVAGLVMGELQHAWREVISGSLKLDGIETDPQQLRPNWPHSERVVQFELEVTLDEARGSVRLCLPMNLATVLCPTADSANDETASASGKNHAPSRRSGESSVVSFVAHLAPSKLTANDVAGLRPGDIITTEHGVNAPLLIRVDGVEHFHARPGALEGRKAVQIEGLVDPPA